MLIFGCFSLGKLFNFISAHFWFDIALLFFKKFVFEKKLFKFMIVKGDNFNHTKFLLTKRKGTNEN